MDKPNNTVEMMEMAALAAEEDDTETLQMLRDVNQEWMQTVEEMNAMDYILDVLQTKVVEALVAATYD
jgi:pyruvate kinase